jgi:hypothetical protein
MFIYRWIQTTQENDLLRLASNMKLYFLSYLVICLICTLLIVVPLNMQFSFNDEIKREMQQVDPIVFEHIKGHVSIGLNVGPKFIIKINAKFRFTPDILI